MRHLVLALSAFAVLTLGAVAAQPEPRDVDDALRQAAALEAAGDPGAAISTYQWALERAQPGSAGRARALDGLAALEARIGQYATAIRHGREAAAIYAALADAQRQAMALNRVGRAAAYAGDYSQAEKAFESAIALSSASGDDEAHAEQLGNLGSVSLYLGRYSDALGAFDKALGLVDAAGDEEWARRRRRILLANKATLYRRLGRHQDALAIYAALGTSRDVRPEEHAQILVNQGVLFRRIGDPVKALETYDDALRLFARDRHVDGELGVLKNRGLVLALDLGRFEEAEQTFSKVIELAARTGNRREVLVTHVFRGEARLRAGDPEGARTDFAASLALARELQTPDQEWQALFGLGRVESRPGAASQYLAESVSVIERLREDIAELSLRSEFFYDKRAVYDALIAARLERTSPAEAFALIERSHSRAWRERLGLTSSVDLHSVQRALPARVLLLDYWTSPLGSALVAVTRTRAAVLRVSVDEVAVKALIDGLSAGPERDWRPSARAIAASVLPARGWFDGIDHVVVVADGALALVPFEVLGDEDSLLIRRAAVSYVPTAAVLLRQPPTTGAWAPPWKLQLQAFADPVFSSASFDDPAPLRARLGASAREVREVAAEISGAAALYVGAENRKVALYHPAERAPILHLATHATADASAIEQSRILFSPPESGSSADYLFLRDAYELPLTGVELAVLSACDTERGPQLRGEGVQSFSRAFLAAGARSTVTTLWRVADRPTSDLMKVFYHHLQRGLSRAEALRRAKLRLLESGSALAHPHFWAAFVLTGDGMSPIPRVLSWDSIALAAAVIVLGPWAVVRLLRARRLAVFSHSNSLPDPENAFQPATPQERFDTPYSAALRAASNSPPASTATPDRDD